MRVERELIAAERLVILTISGDLGDRDLLELAGHIARDPEVEPDFSLLIDLREAHGDAVTGAGVRSLSARPLVLSLESRRAVVVPSDSGFGMARMYELLRGERGGGMRVFRDFDEARRWITAPALDAD